MNKKYHDGEVKFFPLGDGAHYATADQNTVIGYGNIGRTLNLSMMKGADLKICTSCVDARGLKNVPLIDGTEINSLTEFTRCVVESNQVLTF